MAIFSHKWLMLWRKKHIVINLSWHGGYGSLLSSFEVLEVPKTHNSSIVAYTTVAKKFDKIIVNLWLPLNAQKQFISGWAGVGRTVSWSEISYSKST